jgi:hypothetical protein
VADTVWPTVEPDETTLYPIGTRPAAESEAWLLREAVDGIVFGILDQHLADPWWPAARAVLDGRRRMAPAIAELRFLDDRHVADHSPGLVVRTYGSPQGPMLVAVANPTGKPGAARIDGDGASRTYDVPSEPITTIDMRG